ncbi:hypothetical protein Acid7E03_28370 [Acidisoma sp. 7E03]
MLVPCFNTVTYVRVMVEQLQALGLQNIVLVDNASEYPPMMSYLKEMSSHVQVVWQKENKGPRSIFQDPLNLSLFPQYFCVTDPDLLFNWNRPPDFLAQLVLLTEREKIGKAGFAIDISDPDSLRDDDFFVVDQTWKIWEWESKFWKEELPPTPSGDPVYKANIDTTFAVYNKAYLDPTDHFKAVRVGGTFTCKHLPWYKSNRLPPEEEAFYRKVATHSYYLRSQELPPPE